MEMQQFEKRFVKSTTRDIRKSYCRDTWKAALGFVKNRSEISKSLYMIDVNDIDEELGDN